MPSVPAPLGVLKHAHATTNAVEYVFADDANRATITIIGQAGSLASSGADGAAQVANAQPLVADVPFSVRLKSGRARAARSIFVAVGAAADVVVIAEAD